MGGPWGCFCFILNERGNRTGASIMIVWTPTAVDEKPYLRGQGHIPPYSATVIGTSVVLRMYGGGVTSLPFALTFHFLMRAMPPLGSKLIGAKSRIWPFDTEIAHVAERHRRAVGCLGFDDMVTRIPREPSCSLRCQRRSVSHRRWRSALRRRPDNKCSRRAFPLVTQLGRRLFNASSSAFDPLRTSINPKHPCEGIIQLLKSTCVPIGGNAPTRRQIFAPTVSPRVE
jgi:hypothetical protein